MHTTTAPAAKGSSRRRAWRDRLGGVEGNEILTSTVALALIVLLAVEGVTVVHMGGLVDTHMFVGLTLIPPVAVKLGSTGYRFARYYSRAPSYRAMGPPFLPLRLLAPVLVASTVAIFVSGVLLLAAGHKSDLLLEIHKVSFIVFAVVFVPHFLYYLPRVVRSLRGDWRAARREAVPGAGVRAMLVSMAAGGGAALALALLPTIDMWRG
jgi:hypothetical protein